MTTPRGSIYKFRAEAATNSRPRLRDELPLRPMSLLADLTTLCSYSIITTKSTCILDRLHTASIYIHQMLDQVSSQPIPRNLTSSLLSNSSYFQPKSTLGSSQFRDRNSPSSLRPLVFILLSLVSCHVVNISANGMALSLVNK